MSVEENRKAVLDWLDAGAPEHEVDAEFNMGHIYEQDAHDTCGTVCCICGFVLATAVGIERAIEMNDNPMWDTFSAGAALIGLPLSTANRLFLPYTDSTLHEITPEQAAKACRAAFAGADYPWESILEEDE